MYKKLFATLSLVTTLVACGTNTHQSSTKDIVGNDETFYGLNKTYSIEQSLNLALDSTAGAQMCFSLTSDGYALHLCDALSEQVAGIPSIRKSQAVVFDRIENATPGSWDTTVHELFAVVKNNKRVGDMVVDYTWTRTGAYYASKSTAKVTLRFICNGPYKNVCALELKDGGVSINTRPTLQPLQAQY